ncbi:hypothetical protein EXE43_16710 [Halorubrum sp. SS5]|nr:hypothetical protein EXE43_16710 [Halorubrum sp. SS5]
MRLYAVDNRIQSLWGDGLPDEMMLRTDGHEIRDAICLLVVKPPVGIDEELPRNQMVDRDILSHLLLMIYLGHPTPWCLTLVVIAFQRFLSLFWPVRAVGDRRPLLIGLWL